MSRELTRQEKTAIRSACDSVGVPTMTRTLAACCWTAPCYMLEQVLDGRLLPLFPRGGAAP